METKEFEYRKTGSFYQIDCKEVFITKYNGTGEIIHIPWEINGLKVTNIELKAFAEVVEKAIKRMDDFKN